MKIDSLQQSVKGPGAAAFVPRIIRNCIIHLFVLGTKLDKIDSLQQSVKGPAAAGFVPGPGFNPGLNGICIVQLFVLGTERGLQVCYQTMSLDDYK